MADIGDAQRIIWVTETIDGESAIFRAHIAAKAQGALSDVHDAMEDFWVGLKTAPNELIGNSTLRETRVLDWVPAETQYFQTSSQGAVALTTASQIMPVQCASVITYRAVQPLGGRRQSYQNRSFLGPLRSVVVTTEGKLSAAVNAKVLAEVQDFHDAIQAVEARAGVTFASGLAVVSETLPAAHECVIVTQGQIIDTQRRRRRSLLEEPASIILT